MGFPPSAWCVVSCRTGLSPAPALEREAERQPNRAHAARAGDRTEAGVVRPGPIRVDRTVGQELRVARCLAGRVDQLQLRLPVVPVDDVERVEGVHTHLDGAPAAEADVA